VAGFIKVKVMDHQGDLGRLEAIIEKLLVSFGELKKENRAVAAKLAEREQELAALGEENQALKEEKGQVYQRVAGLIDSIEKWEDLESIPDGGEDPAKDKSSTVPDKGGSANALFGIGS